MQEFTMSENEVYDCLYELRKTILPHTREIMKEHRQEVFDAIEKIFNVLEIACYRGLNPLLWEGKELKKSDSKYDQFLAVGIRAFEDYFFDTCIIEEMLKVYQKEERTYHGDFIMFLYMRGILAMQSGISPKTARKIFLSMLPYEERVLYEK